MNYLRKFGIEYNPFLKSKDIKIELSEYKQLLYKDQGYTKGKWIAEPTACKFCMPKDDKVFKLDDIDVPLHPNCRCSFVPYFEYKHSKIDSN